MYFHWASQDNYDWFKIAARLKLPSEPIRSPTMSGGIFAINRQWFLRSGGYDTGMEVWGGENVELSFRVSSVCREMTLNYKIVTEIIIV